MVEDETPRGLPGAPVWKGVVSNDGTTWRAFRRTLKPRYGRVWFEVAVCYLTLVGSLTAAVVIERAWGLRGALVGVPVLALLVGLCLNALSLYGHEAAHGNVAGRRSLNDALSEWFLWPWFAQTAASFRVSHWQHHLHLGEGGDTEISYRECLDPWFLLRAVTGVSLLLALFRYARANQSGEVSPAAVGESAPGSPLFAAGRTVALNALIVGSLCWVSAFVTAFAWVAGVLVAYPLVATLRQILEHRRAEAGCEEDFGEIDHGPVLRMFARGVFARCFGAAGFDRHLLHHWEPSVSYTCFDEMEAYVERTPLAGSLRATRSTYAQTLSEMLRSARRG